MQLCEQCKNQPGQIYAAFPARLCRNCAESHASQSAKMREYVLWGVKAGNPDWDEEVLSTQKENFERVKALAAKAGYGRFRVAVIDLSTPPDFTKTVTSHASRSAQIS